jgi:hypothetical protein
MDEANDAVAEVKVAKPEDWPAATEVKKAFTLQTLSGPMTFNLRALSLGELRELEAALPYPEAPLVRGVPNGEDPAYQERLSGIEFARKAMWLDRCWKPLPGNTQPEKIDWAQKNISRPGELDALYEQMCRLSGASAVAGPDRVFKDTMLNFRPTGMEGERQPVTAATEADPATWAKATQTGRLSFKIPHDVPLVFSLAGLSQLKVNQIKDVCRPPAPPMRVQEHIIKGQRPGPPIPDLTDPTYVQSLKDAELAENCLTLEAALFELPGTTKEAKRQWLDSRPAYEVMSLVWFLNRAVLSYRSQVADF